MIRNWKSHIALMPSFKTSRKILVIESDDWGSIRTRSVTSAKRLLGKGYPMQTNPYTWNDALERNIDLEGLLTVLSSVKNHIGQNPKVTLNYISSNLDFHKIKESNYNSYFYLNSRQQRKLYKHTNMTLLRIYM